MLAKPVAGKVRLYSSIAVTRYTYQILFLRRTSFRCRRASALTQGICPNKSEIPRVDILVSIQFIMRKAKNFLMIGFAMFIASSSVAWAFSPLPKSGAEHVVKKFYGKIVTAKSAMDPADPSGIYRQVLTSEVVDLYSRAMARSAAIQAATGGKPEMGDQVWTSVSDAASTCLLGSVSGTRSPPEVEIRYVSVGDTRPSVTDVLVLKKELGEWKIDDICYGKSGKSGLRYRLARAISKPISVSRQPMKQ